MITLLDLTNNMIQTQQLYVLFFITINNFLKLLQTQNNIYKDTNFYIEHINELLSEDKLSLTKSSIFIIMAIYNENLKYRHYMTKDKNFKHTEREIINKLIFILSNDNLLDHIIIKINNILSINFQEHYHKYKEHYACELNINYNIITKINSENIKDIYENFHKIKRLIILSKLEESYDMEEINEIDNCLFCLFYYNE